MSAFFFIFCNAIAKYRVELRQPKHMGSSKSVYFSKKNYTTVLCVTLGLLVLWMLFGQSNDSILVVDPDEDSDDEDYALGSSSSWSVPTYRPSPVDCKKHPGHWFCGRKFPFPSPKPPRPTRPKPTRPNVDANGVWQGKWDWGVHGPPPPRPMKT